MDDFDREFSGLFFGEGCIDISRQGREAHHIRPRVRIGMHGRERPMLEEIRARYGGSLTTRPGDGSVTWQLTGGVKLRRVAEVLARSVLMSAKRSEVDLLLEALDLRANPIRMAEIQREMSALKH